jgi:predicted lysophospholipase L1 biosynthesis ABC-type transport system permease subunit
MSQVMRMLQMDSPDALPLVIASHANTHHLSVGDQIVLELGNEPNLCEIVGITTAFPLVGDVFAVTDLSRFTQLVDLEALTLAGQGSRELWIAVEASEHEAILGELTEAGFGNRIAGNSQEQLNIFQNNLVFREVSTAFELNALVLIPLSVVGFFLIQYFSAKRREDEFIILQVIGLSKPQFRGLLIFDGCIYITLGLLIGTGVGYGLATVMKPFLSQILPPMGGRIALAHMLIDWSEIGTRYVTLISIYGIGSLILMVSAIRNLSSKQIFGSRK